MDTAGGVPQHMAIILAVLHRAVPQEEASYEDGPICGYLAHPDESGAARVASSRVQVPGCMNSALVGKNSRKILIDGLDAASQVNIASWLNTDAWSATCSKGSAAAIDMPSGGPLK
jgi:hypothetical protein